MLFRRKQMKHLRIVGDQVFHFVDSPEVTDEEREKLMDLDNQVFELEGFHMIENFEELSRTETK